MKMQKELDHILSHFPGYRGRIIELYSKNEEFKLFCEEYWQCRNTLLKFQEHLREDANAESEYHRLCQELEKDAMRFLAEFK